MLAAALALGACAPLALERPAPSAAFPPATAFDVSGRLSVRHGSDALAASFGWQHARQRDELELTSPLGQTLAVLSGDSEQVQLRASDGRVLTAADWTALTERGLGWPLPVEGLASWIQGASRPGTTFSVETGADGRPALLRQDGWTIVYQDYMQTDAHTWRPSRLTLSYPDVELRIAIDRWQE